MKVLVTGGAGFIGSHLVNKLVEEHEVVVLDNLVSGKKENINDNAVFIEGDIRNIEDVRKAITGCSVVFHLAALTDIRMSSDEIDEVNYLGAKNVFDVAKENGAKIVFTSSAAVYGDSQTKEDSDCKPISEYGESKIKAEKYLKNGFIARLFNVYGPCAKSVINKFIKRIAKNEEITVFGDGNQTRDFVYISDVIDSLILGIKNSGTFNVGTGKETSVLDLTEIISKITNNKPNIKFAPERENEIKKSKADITKIKEFGWAPNIQLSEGIKLTLESEK